MIQRIMHGIFTVIHLPNKILTLKSMRNNKNIKLHIGCGQIKLQDWINIDVESGAADLVLDIRKGIPFKDGSAQLIYNEHFIEHLTYDEGCTVINEFYRLLQKGGIIRIATPDLDYIVEKYLSDWRNQEWLSWPEYQNITSKGQMLNICMTWWGHHYIYNEEDLKSQLVNAGFSKITRLNWGVSSYKELSNLETRIDSKLILEAEKS